MYVFRCGCKYLYSHILNNIVLFKEKHLLYIIHIRGNDLKHVFSMS